MVVDLERARPVAGARAVAREVLLVTALYLTYEYVAALAPGRAGLARRHAALVARLTPGPLRGIEAHLREATLQFRRLQTAWDVRTRTTPSCT